MLTTFTVSESLHLRVGCASLLADAVRSPESRRVTIPAQAVLRALAEPRRVAILKLIRSRELAAGDIASRFKTTRPAISQHLRVLVRSGLVSERRESTRRLYRLRPDGFEAVRSFLDLFWDDSLSRLKGAVEADGRRR
jgi:DNA-binding transcriptional ArsR family regulator